MVGNLVDNALDATAGSGEPRVDVRWSSTADGDRASTVATRARACRRTEEVFRQGFTTKATPARTAGRGFGLALTRLVCRRRGGT